MFGPVKLFDDRQFCFQIGAGCLNVVASPLHRMFGEDVLIEEPLDAIRITETETVDELSIALACVVLSLAMVHEFISTDCGDSGECQCEDPLF